MPLEMLYDMVSAVLETWSPDERLRELEGFQEQMADMDLLDKQAYLETWLEMCSELKL